ncbi:MAG TPA: hypothetical protein PKD17_00260 [Cellvibrionaceae bacterium]|nr:hypothetical protein [Cellvibrionaceae bacterium]HMW70216.1 hypothetical protein [Cellvibrionaceae bacterium]HNG61055.1 hypothetical protein [Cellvibrionaceae bacterium]
MNECIIKLVSIFCLYAAVGGAVAVEAAPFLEKVSSSSNHKVFSCSVGNAVAESGCMDGFETAVHTGGSSLNSTFINSSLSASFDSIQGHLKSNNYQIAPYCVEVCVIYTDGRKGRCYWRCAFGYEG